MDNTNEATRVTDPGGQPVDQIPTAQPPIYFEAYVPSDVLDRARLEARNGVYGNSDIERRYIAAVDEAVFDRVRPVERHIIEQAENELLSGRARIDAAGEVLGELEAIRDELRRGGDTTKLAKRYRDARTQADRLGSLLRASNRRLLGDENRPGNSYREKLSDPIAATQRILSIMPLQSFQPIDPTPYLD